MDKHILHKNVFNPQDLERLSEMWASVEEAYKDAESSLKKFIKLKEQFVKEFGDFDHGN